MPFCTNCGKKIEDGSVCDECRVQSGASDQVSGSVQFKDEQQEKVYKSAGSQDSAGSGFNRGMNGVMERIKADFGKMTSSSAFNYYKKRIFNTSARQEDDDYKLSVIGIAVFYALLFFLMIFRGMDLLVGMGAMVARMSGLNFGMDDADMALKGLKSFGSVMGNIGFSISLFALFSCAVGAVTGLIFYKLDKEKKWKDFVCAYANRLVLATLLLAIVFVFSLILRKISIVTGLPAILFSAAWFLNSMAGVTLIIEETHVGGNKKFYVYTAAVFIQMVVIGFVGNMLTAQLSRF